MRPLRYHALVALLFLGLTVLVTYPQVRGLATSVPRHGDPYFSMWRLGWVAHALRTAPGALFEANIFFPAHDTLAYSDAMLLPGAVAAPLFWAGVRPVLVYNLALLAAFAASGYAAFLLARTLTGSAAGSIAAGVVFAFAPYQFCHYVHLELQIVCWVPLALLLVHRILATGSVRDGVLLGLAIAAQLLSSIYSGIFLLVYLAVVVPVLLAASSGAIHLRRWLVPMAVGALLAATIVAPYALAYKRAESRVGVRGLNEAVPFSASTKDYLSVPASNRLYGWTATPRGFLDDEMNLFPGILACVLALVGVVGGRGRARFAYLAGLAASVEMTRGASSVVYVWLYEHVSAFQALRVPARFDVMVNLSLGVLSAYGIAALLARIANPRWRRAAAIALVAMLVAERASAPVLEPAPGPTRADALLAGRPASVVIELPVLSRRGFWGTLDPLYMYQSVGHFQRMINGYSGHAPASIFEARRVMSAFPDDPSMAFLRTLGVDYVVVRAGLYDGDEGKILLDRLGSARGVSLEAMWPDGPMGAEAVYKVNREPDRP